MEKKKYEIKIDNSEKIIFEFSNLAKNANASVLVSQGDTKVLVTVVMGKKSQGDFLPLRIDYLEKYYARGEILGGKYNKREGKPSEEAILTARVIDRTIRPLLPQDLRNEIQIIASVLSLGKYDPDILAINGASLALAVSEIPNSGPTASIRISEFDDKIKLNPDFSISKNPATSFNSVFSGKKKKITMIETEAKEVSEKEFLLITKRAIKYISTLENFFKKIVKEIGLKKTNYEKAKTTKPEIKKIFETEFQTKIKERFLKNGVFKEDTIEDLIKILKEKNIEFNKDELAEYINKQHKYIFQDLVLNKKTRFDKRKFDEIRPIEMSVEKFSNTVHGNGVFYRGDTHVMSFLTIGSLDDALISDQMEIQAEERFMHHYNFPPYATGETKRLGSPNRREIGHGRLAQKALKSILPSEENFPHTIRLVSEVMSSNGSSSMASICASSLALRNGGVPISKHIAGIAIGLVYANEKKYKLLTDIKGEEDFYGHMDFKIAGTKKGISAIQLDLKIDGISIETIEQSLRKAKKARLEILKKMDEAISKENNLPASIPNTKLIKIPKSKIGIIIGKKGATIKYIEKQTNTTIEIEDNGNIVIKGNQDEIQKAVLEIKNRIN